MEALFEKKSQKRYEFPPPIIVRIILALVGCHETYAFIFSR